MRWWIDVGDHTDQILRTHLGRRGGPKGALARFVERVVHDKIFFGVHEKIFFDTLAQAKDRTSRVSDEEMATIIGEAIAWARETRT